MSIWEIIVNWFAKLFGKKKPPAPPPAPKLVEVRWSGLSVVPDTGSASLGAGDAGQARTTWDNPATPLPLGRMVKFVASLSAPVEGGIDVMLYKFVGANLVPMWVPTIHINPGQSSGEFLFADAPVIENMSAIAWISYPPGLGNTKPLDVRASLFIQP